jgi:hypothetical protein
MNLRKATILAHYSAIGGRRIRSFAAVFLTARTHFGQHRQATAGSAGGPTGTFPELNWIRRRST